MVKNTVQHPFALTADTVRRWLALIALNVVCMTIDVARIFRDGIWPRGSCHRAAPGDPIVSKGVHFATVLRSLPAPGAPAGMVGHRSTKKRAHLAAESPVCIPRKFTMVTLRRRVRGPRESPLSPVGRYIGTRPPPPGYVPAFDSLRICGHRQRSRLP